MTALLELLSFPACWIARLPAACSMLWRPTRATGGLFVSTSTARSEAARRRGDVVLVGRELDALITAAENDRATPGVLATWCEHKRVQPTWVLTLDAALGGLRDVVRGTRGWTLERVLRAYAVELVGVAVGDDEPVVIA